MDPEGRSGGEELGGVKVGETIIRIYCMGKKSIKRNKEITLYFTVPSITT